MSANYELRGNVAVITLDNPPVNGLGHATRLGIVNGLEQAIADAAVKAIVITGAGKAFSGGADIKEFGSPKALAEPNLLSVILALEASTKPIVAAIHTVCMGGGLELALGCHYRVASAGTQVALPEVKIGLIPGAGGTQRLPRVIGEARAMEMIMLGRTVAAEEAHRIGLVHRLVEGNAVDAAMAFAHEFTGYSLLAQNLAREAVSRALDVPIQEGLKIEADLSTLAFGTADAAEGMAAFTEKRKANFKDE
jgi:enoyl-CoA hydratase/carnithine racemase